MSASSSADAPPGDDGVGAFINRTSVPGTNDTGPLSGMSFCAKDIFDVKGQKTGAGSPAWLAEQHPAAETAPAVQALLDAGAALVGKTHMDELAYSLNGENAHYGTPLNVAAPGRIPGGSSSGSAAATAAGEVDFGLGSDTAGSVRVPASYCGILGFRPSHGRVSLSNAVPLAQAFDTAGWFARDAETLRSVGSALLATGATDKVRPQGAPGQRRWLVSTDAFDLSDDETRQAIYDAMSVDFPAIINILGSPKELCVATVEGLGGLEEWLDVFRVIQASEAWTNHGGWIQRAQPDFGPGIKERFEAASKVTAEEVEAAVASRERITAHVDALLGDDGILALPTCPGPAPKLNTPTPELELFRRRLLSLSALAPLCRLPQVTLPIAEVDGCPVGLSLICSRNADESLLEVAAELMRVMPAATGEANTATAASSNMALAAVAADDASPR